MSSTTFSSSEPNKCMVQMEVQLLQLIRQYGSWTRTFKLIVRYSVLYKVIYDYLNHRVGATTPVALFNCKYIDTVLYYHIFFLFVTILLFWFMQFESEGPSDLWCWTTIISGKRGASVVILQILCVRHETSGHEMCQFRARYISLHLSTNGKANIAFPTVAPGLLYHYCSIV